MRAPFQEGDFPAPVKYGYLNVGVVEHGPAGAARTDRVLPLPAPDAVCGAGRGGGARAGRACRPRGPCWPARSRPRSTRSGTPGRCSATGSPWSAPAWSAAASPRCWPGSRAWSCSWSTPTRARRRWPGARRRLRRAGRRRRRRDLVVHASATARRAAAVAGAARAGGHRVELSWYGDRQVEPAARRCVPLRPADHPQQPGRRGRPARRGTAARDRLALALDLLRDPAFDALITGRSPFAELPTVLAGLASGEIPALCHLVTYGE